MPSQPYTDLAALHLADDLPTRIPRQIPSSNDIPYSFFMMPRTNLFYSLVREERRPMTDSTAAIPPAATAIETPALQFAHATDHSKNAQSTAATNAALLLQLALASASNASLTNDVLNLGNNQAIPTSDIIANEGLINLDTGTFLLLNDIVTNLGVTGVGGNLTARQIEASDIIQRDLLGLVGAFGNDSLIQISKALIPPLFLQHPYFLIF